MHATTTTQLQQPCFKPVSHLQIPSYSRALSPLSHRASSRTVGLHREACLGKTERGKEWPSPSQGTNGAWPKARRTDLEHLKCRCLKLSGPAGETQRVSGFLVIQTSHSLSHNQPESLWPDPPGPPGGGALLTLSQDLPAPPTLRA